VSTDAVVVGAGPNGLAAAIVLARAGVRVTVLEAESTIGGGARSAELTLSGFIHDLGSAVHPLAAGSPFFRTLPLHEHGLEWIHSESVLAHPLDDRAVIVERDVAASASRLGIDAPSYQKLFQRLADDWQSLAQDFLGPPRFPRHPFAAATFGVNSVRSATGFARRKFKTADARALFAGLAAHSMRPLESALSASFGLVLGATCHAIGWPIPRGGAQNITNALGSYLYSLGGRIEPEFRVRSMSDVSQARTVLFDVTPRQLLQIMGERLPPTYRRSLERYKYGPGAFKVDYALSEPIPWRSPECARAITVHLGGALEEIAESERAPWSGAPPEKPFVLLAQPTIADPSRAPQGKHVAWAYCHVPNGSTFDMLPRIEAQIERFAPGFRECIIARLVSAPVDLERQNANLVGGDIGGGASTPLQMFLRPNWHMYRTPVKGVYLCSSSTPPGGGVHGMCGFFAAQAALRDLGISR
jgi:phytoene dehydrogenase-like protein